MKKEKNHNFKELMQYAKGFRWLTYASLFLSGISGILALVPFVFIWLIIREVLEVNPDFSRAEHIVFYGWMAVLFSLLSMLIYVLGLMCSHISAFRVAANIRSRLIRHITELPVGCVEDMGSGKIRKIITESSAGTETFLAHQLPDMAGAIITPICMVVLLFVFDWRLGLVSLIPFALGFGAMFKMAGPAMAQDMKLYQDSLEDMTNEAVEYVRGIPVVKTFGQTVFSFKRFRASISNYGMFCIAYTKKCRRSMLIFQTCVNSVFVFLIGLALIIAGRGIINEVFLLNLLFYIIFTPIIATSLTKVMFMSENVMLVGDCLTRIHSILNFQVLSEPENPLEPRDNSIEFQNVSFQYSNSACPALDDVSFRIEPNQLIALVGPSGGGKTTAASLISRFYDVTQGEIRIGGIPIRQIRKKRLMEIVSYVFQDSKLLKTSILENVRLSKPDASRTEVLNALSLAQCDDILAKLPNGVDTVIGSKGVYLSGGQQQRIAIARTMLKDSPIVILDEATAFADPENEASVQKAFEELAKNKMVIMIAHRLSSIRNADMIYVLDNGKIAEAGKHTELMEKHGIYYKMTENYETSVSWKVGRNHA